MTLLHLSPRSPAARSIDGFIPFTPDMPDDFKPMFGETVRVKLRPRNLRGSTYATARLCKVHRGEQWIDATSGDLLYGVIGWTHCEAA